MDEIEQRLKETSEACIKAYTAWSASDKDEKATEALQEAVHDLRKVASRLEIEIAIRDRAGAKSQPLEIPTHKSTRKNKGSGEDDTILGIQEDDDNIGNGNGNGNGGGGDRKRRSGGGGRGGKGRSNNNNGGKSNAAEG